MRALISTLFVLMALTAQNVAAQNLDAEREQAAIKHAVDELRLIRKIKNAEERGAALQALKKPDDSKVAKALAPFLLDKVTAISNQALNELRYMKNDGALVALLKYVKRRSVVADRKLYQATLLAIGQHGSKKALPVLTDDIWDPKTTGLFNTRVTAISHIRAKESIDMLIEIMRKGKSRKRKSSGLTPAQRTISQGLFALTGHKIKDGSATDWKDWWRAHRSGFEVADTPTNLPEKEAKRWQRLWTSPEDRKRQEEEKKKDRARRKKRKEKGK